MHKHPDHHDLAGRTWARLLVLRANDFAHAIPDLRGMMSEIGVAAGPALDSERKVRHVQSEAWLSVCALAQAISLNPKGSDVAALWDDAISKAKTWEREAE